MRRSILLLGIVLLQAISGPVFSQSSGNLSPGTIIDTVRCEHDPEQSYSLYLPAAYQPERPWPIMYVFDPAARGRLPLERLRLASETHGIILVASNNSRNGSWSECFKAAQAVFDDTWGRFSIDTGQVYACGFSGGARVATALAINSGRIAGVIACGAGFPTVPEYQPREGMPFFWIGVVGNRDMNYLEVHKVRDQITGLGGRAHVLEFDGRHAWPAADTFLMAADLLRMETRLRAASQSVEVSDAMRDRLRKRASDYAAAGRPWDAGTFLMSLNASLPAHFGEEDKARAGAWLASKDAVKAGKEREKTLKREDEWQRKLSEQFILDLNFPDDSACTRFWKEEGSLLHKLQQNKSEEKAKMADRLINQLWVRCYEMGQRAMESEQTRSAATYYLIWSCVQPGSMFAHYHASRAFAKLDKRKFALHHLQKAIDHGLKDPARLEVEDYDGLRDSRAFKKQVARLPSDISPVRQ